MATAKKSAGAAKKSTPAKKAAGGAAAKKGAAPAKKAAPAKSAAKSGAKSAAKGGAAKRAPNPAFMKPMTPSADLAAVIGDKPVPRSEVAKKIWEYIHKNNLQDQQNKRQINADDNLRKVFGGKKSVSMFEMTKLVNQHLS